MGNRLSSLGVSWYSYNVSNELTSTSSANYGYDANGNTASKTDSTGTSSYSWDFENRLTSVSLPGSGGTVTFKYDPFGRRVQKSFTQNSTTTTTNYVYDDVNDIEEVDQNGNVLARYVQGQDIDQPLAESRSGTTSYYEQDGLDTVTSLSNGAGALAQTYTLDSFGNTTHSTGSLTNPFRFTGREFDTETGLYNYRARYFDPTIGRFLSEDPLGIRDNLDMYVYVGNNPASYDDPFGLYTLKGFSPDQQVQMTNAINDAIAKLTASCAGADGPKVANAMQGATFVYNPKMKPTLCGQTGPLSFLGLRHVVSLGPSAFTPKCCSLASTVAHEAVHLTGGGEGKAYGLEKTCFGCGQ